MVLFWEPDIGSARLLLREIWRVRRQVLWTRCGGDVCELVRREQFSALIVPADQALPQALDAIQWVSQYHPDTVILAMINPRRPATRVMVMNAGAWSCMDLPLRPISFRERLLRLLKDPLCRQPPPRRDRKRSGAVRPASRP